MPAPPYREIHYPLNVFMHVLTHEEGGVSNLHYGFFERGDETMAQAQEHASNALLERLPPAPAKLLDVGSGVGTTLARLTDLGYDVEGITPDAKQIDIIQGTFADRVNVRCLRFEDLEASRYDAVIFQESSQYIDANALFSKAREVTSHVIVFDEFATEPATLHGYDEFMRAAEANGFEVIEETDVSQKAAPTVDYFNVRIPRYRNALAKDLGITAAQIDELVAGGADYRDKYARGAYVYRILQFRR